MSELEQSLKKIIDLAQSDSLSRVESDFEKSTRAAVCVLFKGDSFLQSQVLLTLRSSTVATHVGQVAFPGGRTEPQDLGDEVRTALRECEEEVGISALQIKPIGLLPRASTLSSDFLVRPVIAITTLDPILQLSAEVEKAEWVSVQSLQKTRLTQDFTHSGTVHALPVFSWGEHKLWGLSAWIFDSILKRYDILSS